MRVSPCNYIEPAWVVGFVTTHFDVESTRIDGLNHKARFAIGPVSTTGARPQSSLTNPIRQVRDVHWRILQ